MIYIIVALVLTVVAAVAYMTYWLRSQFVDHLYMTIDMLEKDVAYYKSMRDTLLEIYDEYDRLDQRKEAIIKARKVPDYSYNTWKVDGVNYKWQ